MIAFEKALQRTLGFEGGESDVAGDRGGHTKWGVTQRRYDAWRITTGRPKQSVSSMTVEEMKELYWDGEWHEIRGNDLPEDLATVVFDMAVNSGSPNAVHTLQRSLGVSVDGKIGPLTLATAHSRGSGAVLAFLKQRAAFIQGVILAHPSDVAFLEGWINRLLDQAWRAE